MKVSKKIALIGAPIASFVATNIAFAQNATVNAKSLGDIFNLALNILSSAIPILISVIVIMVAWYAIQFVKSAEPAQKNEARHHLINAIIALFVVFSLFGIIRVLQNTVFGGSLQNNSATGTGLNAPQIYIQ